MVQAPKKGRTPFLFFPRLTEPRRVALQNFGRAEAARGEALVRSIRAEERARAQCAEGFSKDPEPKPQAASLDRWVTERGGFPAPKISK